MTTFQVKNIPIFEVCPYARNPRKNSAAVDRVAASIREFGFRQPLVVDENMTIIAGHTRLEAARKLGLETVPVHIAEGLGETKKKAYRIADNRTSELSSWDDDLLALELEDLQETDFDMEVTGFDSVDIDALLDGGKTEGLTDPDEVPEERDDAVSKPGDVWVLGRHRVMCGDSTDENCINILMNGESANVCLTDPPYGIENTRSEKNNYDIHIDSKENLIDLISRFLPLAQMIAPVVVFTPGNSNQRLYPDSTWTMAWFVPAGSGRGPWGFCCWQPILCYGKDPKLAKGLGSHPDAIVHIESADNVDHPCPKPVKFWSWLMERVSEKGNLVFDPFNGGGTSIISAERTGRKCYSMDISPHYVDVTIRRWQNFTGEHAVLERTGERFDG